ALYVIPLKPDPPIAVDGQLDDWVEVPGQMVLRDPEHASYKPEAWDGPEDLSGTVRMAWRREGLFVAIEVTDDVHSQPNRGRAMTRGDHIELYLDFAHDVEPDRRGFEEGQFQFGFSPGNFKNTGDPVTDIPPEVYCHHPDGLDVSGVHYEVVQTDDGWRMEAMVPFSLLGVSPQQNLPFTGEVALSDLDGAEAAQETMVTIGTDTWARNRQRLVMMLLGNAAAEGEVPATEFPVADSINVPTAGEATVTFETADVPDDKAAFLFFKARIPRDAPAGWTRGLRLSLNDQTIEGDRLTNRPATSMRRVGIEATFISPTGEIVVPYGPDFTTADDSSSYGLMGNVKLHEYEFEITDLLADDENSLHLQSLTDRGSDRDIIVGDMVVRIKTPPPAPPPKAPAPTGPIATIEPGRDFSTDFSVQQPDNATLQITVGDKQFTVQSRFSAPDGTWKTGSCDLFTHARAFEQHPECIIIRDTFTNLTRDVVPVMQRHECDAGGNFTRGWVAGISPAGGDLTTQSSHNPSSYAVTEDAGLGMMPLNDEFQVHVTNSWLDGTLGLSDNSFVLRPGAEYTAEWVIIPTETADFWDFVNIARRVRDVNFTMKYQFGFLSPGRLTDDWDDDTLKRFIENRGVDISCSSRGRARYKGRVPHGTAFQEVDHQVFVDLKERIKRLFPDVLFTVYFHCFLDVHDEALERFYDDRRLRSNGEQGIYSREYMRLFNPTLDNDFGPAIAKNVDIILDTIGADGVYWDEVAYSKYKYHYGEPWDGCTADIDPETHEITRLKSSVTLICLPFQMKLMNRIMSEGVLTANGMPQTRSHAQLQYQAFTETGSISNCLRAILYTPIALGDHRTERTVLDAYRWMLKALDYGCVYNWYSQTVFPEYPTLASHMFPITPMELHEGYIIGEERIVTKVSGTYGWGDASDHEVFVFDDTGREDPDFEAPFHTVDEKTYTELRLPEDYSAAIIRK
ncbi:MAG: sugar-binding protein, partial [Armatimonadota bacterium]